MLVDAESSYVTLLVAVGLLLAAMVPPYPGFLTPAGPGSELHLEPVTLRLQDDEERRFIGKRFSDSYSTCKSLSLGVCGLSVILALSDPGERVASRSRVVF